MKRGISGIYKITNKINGKFYVCASVDISMRYGTHMGRDARNYQHKHKFYKDIIDYGKENFELDMLEECEKDILLEKEQYYYDTLQPQYNKVRPAENNFIHREVQEKVTKNSNTPETVEKRKNIQHKRISRII